MRQSDLDRAVARRTGESVNYIRQRGFTILPCPARSVCPELTGDAGGSHGGDGSVEADTSLAPGE